MHDKFIKSVATNDPLDQSQIFDEVKFNALNKELIGILMTPVCDIAQKRVEYYTLCAVLPFKPAFFKKLINKKINLTPEQFINGTIGNDKKSKILQFLVTLLNNQFDRSHWLGKLPNKVGYWYVDYQLIETISIEQFSIVEKRRLYKLLSPLRESLLVRYSNYTGRVGLPGEKEERDALAQKIYSEMKSGS
jgi:hypothetical protein